jgi:hypothetical protein
MPLLDASGRSEAVQEAAKRFEMDTLTHPDSRQVAMATARLAQEMIVRIRDDDVELARGLNLLAEARGVFVVAVTHKRANSGGGW